METKKAVCLNNNGYEYKLTTGKTYDIITTEAETVPDCGGFTFPAYAEGIGDNDKKFICHLSRFKLIN